LSSLFFLLPIEAEVVDNADRCLPNPFYPKNDSPAQAGAAADIVYSPRRLTTR